MLLNKTVKIKMCGSAIPYYKSKGYVYDRYGEEMEIPIKDLNPNSHIKVDVKCDGKNCNKVLHIPYRDYLKCLHGKNYYCTACSAKLFGCRQKAINSIKSKISISFAEWGINNICNNFLELYWSKNNNISPYNITYSSNKKIILNCIETNYHGEYKISPSAFVAGNRCPYCGTRKIHPKDSFGQYLIDAYGKDAIEKYWCKENKIDPFKIYKSSAQKVILQCQDIDYHHYKIECFHFVNGRRCGMCNSRQVHPLDSFGVLYKDKLYLWSNKNKKSPYKYAKSSHSVVYWKCPDGKHDDYTRSINGTITHEFRCPKCVAERKESILQEKVRIYIESTYPNYILNHEYNCTLVPQNPKIHNKLGRMPFDNEIIIGDKHLIIETNGNFHYDLNEYKYYKKDGVTPEEELHKRKLYDRYKKYVSYRNGYFYMAIPYWLIYKSSTYKKIIDNKIKEVLEA